MSYRNPDLSKNTGGESKKKSKLKKKKLQ